MPMCNFLELPLELRLKIYDHVHTDTERKTFFTFTKGDKAWQEDKDAERINNFTNLAGSCRQVYNECRKSFILPPRVIVLQITAVDEFLNTLGKSLPAYPQTEPAESDLSSSALPTQAMVGVDRLCIDLDICSGKNFAELLWGLLKVTEPGVGCKMKWIEVGFKRQPGVSIMPVIDNVGCYWEELTCMFPLYIDFEGFGSDIKIFGWEMHLRQAEINRRKWLKIAN